jgi:eukaryotic-like serine/threonine-protein kinase
MPEQLVRFPVYPPDKSLFPGPVYITVGVPQFALSPDGNNLAFIAAPPGARPMIWVRPLNQVTARPLAGTEDGEYPFWSFDSSWVGYFANGRLLKIRPGGGPVQVVANDVPDPRGGSWNSDGTILVGSGAGVLLRIPEGGGITVPATKFDATGKERSHRWPHFLPDGRHFLYLVRSSETNLQGVYVGSLDGDKRQLIHSVESPAIYASGLLLFTDGSTLMGQAFDASRRELGGQPFAVAEHVGRASNGYGAFSVSNAGILTYSGANSEAGQLTWFDRNGNAQDHVGPEGDYTDIRLSPDERYLATSLVDPRIGFPDVWITDLTRAGPSRFTFGPALNAGPVWSPDGKNIAFRTTRNGGTVEFYEKSAAGAGNEDALLHDATQPLNLYLTDWSPNGRDLLYSAVVNSGYELWRLPLDTRKPVRLSNRNIGMHANFSPNGQFVSYTSDESGRAEVYVQTYPLSDLKFPVSIGGGYEPRWRGDGREIYYLSTDRKLMAVSVGPGPRFGVPKALFQTRVTEGVTGYRNHYVPSRDGQRFLINTRASDPPQASITVELNWQAGFRK